MTGDQAAALKIVGADHRDIGRQLTVIGQQRQIGIQEGLDFCRAAGQDDAVDFVTLEHVEVGEFFFFIVARIGQEDFVAAPGCLVLERIDQESEKGWQSTGRSHR